MSDVREVADDPSRNTMAITKGATGPISATIASGTPSLTQCDQSSKVNTSCSQTDSSLTCGQNSDTTMASTASEQIHRKKSDDTLSSTNRTRTVCNPDVSSGSLSGSLSSYNTPSTSSDTRRISDCSLSSRDSGIGLSPLPMSPYSPTPLFFLSEEDLPEENEDDIFTSEEETKLDSNQTRRESGYRTDLESSDTFETEEYTGSRDCRPKSTKPIDIPARTSPRSTIAATSVHPQASVSYGTDRLGTRMSCCSGFASSPIMSVLQDFLEADRHLSPSHRQLLQHNLQQPHQVGRRQRQRCDSDSSGGSTQQADQMATGHCRDRSNSAPAISNRAIAEKAFGRELQRIGDEFHSQHLTLNKFYPGPARPASFPQRRGSQVNGMRRSRSWWQRFFFGEDNEVDCPAEAPVVLSTSVDSVNCASRNDSSMHRSRQRHSVDSVTVNVRELGRQDSSNDEDMVDGHLAEKDMGSRPEMESEIDKKQRSHSDSDSPNT